MQNLFLTENDTFEIKLFIAEDEKGGIYCDIEEEGVKVLMGDKDFSIEEYKFVFKKPSFGDLSQLTDLLTSPRKVGEEYIGYESNPIAIKVKTISYLIRDWSLCDDKGNKVPINEDNISKLNPIIASAIGIQLDSYFSTTDEDSK